MSWRAPILCWWLALMLTACEGGSLGSTPITRCINAASCDDAKFASGIVASAGDVVAGKAIFDAQCASCHGEGGKGIREANHVDMTRPDWQSRFRDGGLAMVIKGGRPPTMQGFDLGNQGLRDVIAYIRTLQVKLDAGKGGY